MDYYTKLDELVTLHVRFKIRLRGFLTEPEQTIPDFILRDTVCPLGKWLYGQTDIELTTRDEFTHLIACHRKIHEAATRAAKQAITGDKLEALDRLEPGHDFDVAAKNLMTAVVRLKKVVK